MIAKLINQIKADDCGRKTLEKVDVRITVCGKRAAGVAFQGNFEK